MVKFYSLKGFLQDPFEFQINRTLGIDDAEEDPEKTEFEPVDADFLNLIKLEKMLVALGLGIKPENKIATKEELKKKAIQRGWIPDDVCCRCAYSPHAAVYRRWSGSGCLQGGDECESYVASV